MGDSNALQKTQAIDQRFIHRILKSINQKHCIFNSKGGDNRDGLNCILSRISREKGNVPVDEDSAENCFPLKIYLLESSADSELVKDGIGIPVGIVRAG